VLPATDPRISARFKNTVNDLHHALEIRLAHNTKLRRAYYLSVMKRILPIAALLCLTACGGEPTEKKQDSVSAVVAPAAPTVSEVQPYRPNIEATPWDGDLNDAIYWRDSRGENAVIVSSKPQYFWEEENPKAKDFFPQGEDPETLSELTEIFVTHFVLKSGEAQWKQFNQHHDYLFGCCDVYMAYQPASLQVMDADSNGTGEYFLMYHETQGDGLLTHTFLGTLVLGLDSVHYTVEDETGLGIAMHREKELCTSDQIVLNIPRKGAYSALMMEKWTELYNAKVEQDRAEVTEQNNVDEHGHADHHH
jgi:hypothetical protein